MRLVVGCTLEQSEVEAIERGQRLRDALEAHLLATPLTPDRAPDALDQTIALLADGRLRLRAHRTMPMQQAAEAHRQLEGGHVRERIVLTL